MKINISQLFSLLICPMILATAPVHAYYDEYNDESYYDDSPLEESDDDGNSYFANDTYGSDSYEDENSIGIWAPLPGPELEIDEISYGNDTCFNTEVEAYYTPHKVMVGSARIDLEEFQNLIEAKSVAFVYACTKRVVNFIEPGDVCAAMLRDSVSETSAKQACQEYYNNATKDGHGRR